MNEAYLEIFFHLHRLKIQRVTRMLGWLMIAHQLIFLEKIISSIFHFLLIILHS